MAASQLKRVSARTERLITTLADRENRTFVAQLEVVVLAGLKALGEPIPADDDTPTTATPEPAGKR